MLLEEINNLAYPFIFTSIDIRVTRLLIYLSLLPHPPHDYQPLTATPHHKHQGKNKPSQTIYTLLHSIPWLIIRQHIVISRFSMRWSINNSISFKNLTIALNCSGNDPMLKGNLANEGHECAHLELTFPHHTTHLAQLTTSHHLEANPYGNSPPTNHQR